MLIGSIPGGDIAALQTNLSRLSYNLGPSGVDGKPGPATRAAARLFEQDRGLEVSPNGQLSAATFKAAAAAPFYFRGLDLSENNGSPDFRAIKEAGYSFIIQRATLASRKIDERLSANTAQALAAGLAVTFYHFWYPERDPQQQADFFTETVHNLSGLSGLKFTPCWDVERDSGLEPEDLNRRLKAGLGKLKSNFGGRLPCAYSSKRVYTGYGLLDQGGETLNGEDVAGEADSELWVVRWAKEEAIKLYGTFKEWRLWQSGPASGVPGTQVAGTSGLTDRDLFKGTPEEFKAFFFSTL